MMSNHKRLRGEKIEFVKKISISGLSFNLFSQLDNTDFLQFANAMFLNYSLLTTGKSAIIKPD
jgi:hypothetical protein